MDTIGKLKKQAKEWISDITIRPQEYENFLNFSSNFYKYKIPEVVGIYIQNPKATACADKHTWENKLGKKVVDDYTNIIFCFDYTSNRLKYTKIYDVANTTGDVDINKMIWKYSSEIENQFKEHFKFNIEEHIVQKINECHINYSFINSKDIENFRQIVLKSSLYLVNARCGLEQNVNLNFDYEVVSKYFYEVADNIGEISKPILNEIGNFCKFDKFSSKAPDELTLENVLKTINNVEKNVEENTSKIYSNYDDLNGRIFSFENKNYIVSSVSDNFVEAQDMANESEVPIYRTFKTTTVIDILAPEEKFIEKQNSQKENEPLRNQGSFLRSEDNLEVYQDKFKKRFGFNFHEKQAKVLYNDFVKNEVFKDFLENNYTYTKFQASGFMDLTLETTRTNEVTLAHYFEQNGDLMRDPEITYIILQEEKIIIPITISQDNIGRHFQVNSKYTEQDLIIFSKTWFKNIREQGYTVKQINDKEHNVIFKSTNQEDIEKVSNLDNLDITNTETIESLEEVNVGYDENRKIALDKDIFDVKNYKEPFVVIEWSESQEFDSNEVLTFFEADLKFKEVEKAFRDSGQLGYDKTKGTVYFLDEKNDIELSSYEFRYDIGDYDIERSGLYNHINNYWKNAENALGISYHGHSKEDVLQALEIAKKLEPYQNLSFLVEESNIVFENGDGLENAENIVKEYEEILSNRELTDSEIDDYYLNVDRTNDLKEDSEEIKSETISAVTVPRTEREKLLDNIEVIKTLKEIERTGLKATKQQKEILKKYHGFGAIPDVFDFRKDKYIEERNTLLELLSNKEYRQLEGSTLNAHYTSKEIIKVMYDALGQIGFAGGRVLEPSMGNGRFFEYMPEHLKQSQLYGVELDMITGKIAQALYPHANIQIRGFEETTFNNNFFDVVIGNVPFGDYKVYDKAYESDNLKIHDYFITKSLDKVKNGGVVAVITSSGTLDKSSTSARAGMAEKGALIGAIRLPDTAFKESANTSVVADILFFQKGAKQSLDWIDTKEIEKEGEYFNINKYFDQNPQMVIGDIEKVSGPYGNKLTVKLSKDKNLVEELKKALEFLPKDIFNSELPIDNIVQTENLINLEGYDDVKDFSFIVNDKELYFKYNYGIEKEELKGIRKERVVGQVEIKNIVREILDMQMNYCTNEALTQKQNELNVVYDKFVQKNGYLNSKANKSVFNKDADAPLLLSIENLGEDKTYTKSNIFFERTISPTRIIEHAETPQEALLVSLNNKGYVDIDYMALISNNTRENIITSLGDNIFKNPLYEMDNVTEKEYLTKEKYLSGNILKKIEVAKIFVEQNPIYQTNFKALEKIKPIPLTHKDIRVSMGMQWIPKEIYREFILNTLELEGYPINVDYSVYTGSWSLSTTYNGNVYATKTYGTDRINALKIFEETLNLKTVKIFDTIEEFDGRKTRVLNEPATELAQEKQQLLIQKFSKWIYADEDRKNTIVNLYNEKFNNTVLETFDGSHLTFNGMSNKIQLRDHQKNAIYRVLTKGNTLLHHEVGSGKTFTVVASIMEQKRLGIVNKPIIAVPNHLVEQWASEFMKLYPNANILAITADDMSKNKRLAFTSRIATGSYDAVIISHSSFEKISVSKEHRENMLNEEIYQIERVISETDNDGTVKDLQRILKTKEEQLKRLNNESTKDDLLDFEQLGIDSIYVDEAHKYKNLFNYTKLGRVAGVNTSASQRATDMYLKCQLINQLHNSNKGIVFATGTPVSNSISELHVMQKFLMGDTLKEYNLHFFDNWVANFGEIKIENELKPSGKGFAPRERLATFKNIPELMKLYKEVADVVTNDMIDIELPKLKDEKVTIVSAKPTFELKQFTNSLVKRAEKIKNSNVDPKEDNMLVVTNDGRKAGLDMRLIDESYDDNPYSKVNKCVDNVFRIWDETTDKKSTQLIFCDLSTPKANSQDLKETEFNVYADIRNKLMEKGVPLKEIAFIHDCSTDEQKDVLFDKVRNGEVRVLLGSTEKCGAGTNIQDKLVALHDLDCPWRPSDLEQRMGRIVRQGNENKEVDVIRYVTEESFDAYLWSIVEIKAKFINQILKGDPTIRHFTDESDIVLTCGEIKAIASGDPLIKTSMDLRLQVNSLQKSEIAFLNEQEDLKILIDTLPLKIHNLENTIKNITTDIETILNNSSDNIIVGGKLFEKTVEQGTALLTLANDNNLNKKIGEIAGLEIQYAGRDRYTQGKMVALVGEYRNEVLVSDDGVGSVARIKNALNKYVEKQSEFIELFEKSKKNYVMANNSYGKEWDKRDELDKAEKELVRVEKILAGKEQGKEKVNSKGNELDR